MLNLRYRPFWIAASVVLVLGVVWGSLQSAFGGEVPQGFDKVEHFGTYLFLAVWFTGLFARPRWWMVAVTQPTFTTWRRIPPASRQDCCWPRC
jgi:VanZ family protein